jgi:hypothetical protein
MTRTTRPVLYPAALLVAALLAGCVTPSGYRDNSGISGAAPGADPMIERARGR